MAAKKKPRKSVKKNTSLVVIKCEAHKNKSPCLQRALAAEILAESLASTVWSHRDDASQSVEFVVADTAIVPTGRPSGHFELGVSVSRLEQNPYDDNTAEDMTLHKFLQTFIPVRTISANDQQS